MAADRKRLLLENLGRRLRRVRKQLNYSLGEMAGKLGVSKSGYYKNEKGITFPGVLTLDHLQWAYDISMDWLIFNKGPVFYKEKLPELSPQETLDISSDVREMLEQMAHDRLLEHEVLAFFYKYKENKHQGNESG